MRDHEAHKKLDAILARLGRLEAILILEGQVTMSALDDLSTKVQAEATVIDSACTLLAGLKAALDAAGTDPAKLAALSADIDAQTAKLSAAVLANTPAAPPAPAPAPDPAPTP